MKKYFSTKKVSAEPMNRKEAEASNLVRDIQPPASPDEDGYRVVYPDGYESWSPAKSFEDGYKELTVHEATKLCLVTAVGKELTGNGNKISPTFIDDLVSSGTVSYHKLSSTMRVCVITLASGHEVLGKAQVLDPANDEAAIGNRVAYSNAVNEVWCQVGAIAKALL